MSRETQTRQAGWALLETAIVTMLLAVIAIAAVSTLRGGGRERNSTQPLAVLTQAEQALAGYALAHRQFPRPDEASERSERPGYFEGWLPEKELGLVTGGERIRYLVLKVLAAPPPIHNADPLGLTNGLVIHRTRPTSIDFCVSLLQSEISKKSLKNNLRTAFALQQAHDLRNGGLVPLRNMWLKDMSLPDLPRDVMLHTAQRGFTEISEKLGCFERLDALSSDVKFAGALIDMRLLANQEVLRNQLALRSLNNSIDNYDWRLVNMSIEITVSTVRLLALVLKAGPGAKFAVTAVEAANNGVDHASDSSATESTETAVEDPEKPASIFEPANVVNAVDLGLNIASLIGYFIQVSDARNEAVASLPAVEASVANAKNYVEKLDEEGLNHINAANQNQFLGGSNESKAVSKEKWRILFC